jgi:hypothetical protein
VSEKGLFLRSLLEKLGPGFLGGYIKNEKQFKKLKMKLDLIVCHLISSLKINPFQTLGY